MRIIVSPAKKMRQDTDSFPHRDMPVFLNQACFLWETLRNLSFEECKALWACNDKITRENRIRLEMLNPAAGRTPALLAYDGIQYQYMAPGVFTAQELEYVQSHLRILSGLYGIVRPFDGVIPYRLEMQAKLKTGEKKDLYAYWGNSLARHLFAETDCIINLASREYSQCISRYLMPGIRFITCVFGREEMGKVIERGTLCKMARGEMVRYMAEHQIASPEELKSFDRLNYRFSPEHSDTNTFVYLQNK